jgi:hypothetical protein
MYCDSIRDDVPVDVGTDAEGFITNMRKMSPSPRLRVYMELVKLLQAKVRSPGNGLLATCRTESDGQEEWARS